MNILESCTFYPIDLSRIKNKDAVEDIKVEFGLEDNEDQTIFDGETLSEYKTKYGYEAFEDAIEYEYAKFDDDLLEDILTTLVGNWPHYLCFASGCKWNGASGYGLFEDVKQTVYRNYDISLYLEKEITEKAIVCREHSHDVPMGNSTYIIGINEEEYEKLEYMDFSEVETFVHNICD